MSDVGAQIVAAPSNVETMLTGGSGSFEESEQKPYVFETPEEREVARVTWEVIEREFERKIKAGIDKLETAEVQAEITRIVKEVMAPEQGTFETFEQKTDVAATVAKVTKQLVMHTISIPEIVVLPTSEVNFGFNDFDLSNLETIARQPLSDQIMVQKLRDESRAFLARTVDSAKEERLENYLVRHLMDLPQIDYDTQSELLFKLAGQMVKRLEAYLTTPEDVENVLIGQATTIVSSSMSLRKCVLVRAIRYRGSINCCLRVKRTRCVGQAIQTGKRLGWEVTSTSRIAKRVCGTFSRRSST